MNTKLSDYRLFLLVLAANLLLCLFQPEAAGLSAANSGRFLLEVLSIVPPVMVLMGLLDVWLPRSVVESHLGPDSGMLGAAVAMMLGTAAAGPLYAAFPVAVSLRKKGARTANLVIFLGTWGSIKIPMLLMESSFISLRFALLRLVLTVPFILLSGYLVERLLPQEATLAQPEPADA